jgi:hypothetical protein
MYFEVKGMAKKVLTHDVRVTIRLRKLDRSRLHALAKSENMDLSKFLRALPDMYPKSKNAA